MRSLETCTRAARGESCCLLDHTDYRLDFYQSHVLDTVIVEQTGSAPEIVPIFNMSRFCPPIGIRTWLTFLERNPRLGELHNQIDRLPELGRRSLLAALSGPESLVTEKFPDCGLQEVGQALEDNSTLVLDEIA